MRRRRALIALFVLVIALGGCGTDDDAADKPWPLEKAATDARCDDLRCLPPG